METLSFQRYIELVASTQKAEPEWRVGQTYFNVLHMYRPDLSEMVRGNDIDPFYQDKCLPGFLDFVGAYW